LSARLAGRHAPALSEERKAAIAAGGLLLAPGAVIVYYGFLAGGTDAGLFAISLMLLAIALASRIAAAPDEADTRLARKLGVVALVALRGALVVL